MEFSKSLAAENTSIPGLILFDVPVHGDSRGWFKENWQRQKMVAAGLPDFGPVQNNISFNSNRGTTRGIHAEPWDKYVSVATGSVFGAWVDLREGETFGSVFTAVLDPSKAIYVPRGVANSFQTLEDSTAYVYLVNDHWSADAQSLYTFLNLADPTVAIRWPIPLDDCEISDKDREHPTLQNIVPMSPKRTLILGANGQLGLALRKVAANAGFTHWEFADRTTVDLASRSSMESVPWQNYSTVINAAAYTRVDEAETEQGRRDAWLVNALGVSRLSEICSMHRITLVHVSTDYVFDGVHDVHSEEEMLSPLGVYGQSKAAGELAVQNVREHYILRTSWVIGEGSNFVRTMRALAEKGVSPSVVDDQVGRLTFASELARAIVHLLSVQAPFGVYNVSNGGAPGSWSDIARAVFESSGRESRDVSGVSTEEYFAGKSVAPRPLSSVFDLEKLSSTGFELEDQWAALEHYLRGSVA